jgi:hypothetical protein
MIGTCRLCDQPLVVELEPEDVDEHTSSTTGDIPGTVPDDLELPCGCHFHWYASNISLVSISFIYKFHQQVKEFLSDDG